MQRTEDKLPQDRAQQLYLESLVGQITGWSNPQQRLMQAFRCDEFILYHQPIRPVARERTHDLMEVLVRHQDEEKHLTPPGAFLPVLEYHGMLPMLDEWVTRRFIRWYRENAKQRRIRCFVNVAGATLREPRFAVAVRELLREQAVPGEVLCFEVQEGELLSHTQEIRPTIRALQEAGCNIAVGSVGRQSVSFKSIQAVAARYVKLDGSLVRELHRDPVALAKARAINRVCHMAGMETVAEFVEEPETLEALRSIDVDYAQGFGISRPAPLYGPE